MCSAIAQPDAAAREAVHHDGEIELALPGRDLGRLGDPEPVRLAWREVAAHEIGRGGDARHRDRRAALAPAHHARQPGLAHQPSGALAAHAHAAVAQLGVHPRPAVGRLALIVDGADLAEQLVIAAPPRARRPVLPGVVAGSADAEHAAQQGDGMLCFLRVDQPEAHHRRSVSRAKKAAAALRISRSWARRRFSRRSRRSSSRSSLVSPSRRPPRSSSVCLTQLRSDCGETPSSSAIWGIEPPLERTSSTACRRNSGEYGGRPDGMNTSFLPGPGGPSAQASTKAGQLQDAAVLAQLLAADYLPAVWLADDATHALRRQVARRAHIVRQRTRLKNQVQAILHRNLIPRCPAADLFGHKGRRWLAEQELPADERQAVAALLRQLDFHGQELRIIEAELARVALGSDDVKRLITIPGVDATVALSIVAAVGDFGRFGTPEKLVSYLGLNPRVKQSGGQPASHGRITKQGRAHARGMLVEAAWATSKTPGPLRAFYQRVRARRGMQVAVVATARKLAVL